MRKPDYFGLTYGGRKYPCWDVSFRKPETWACKDCAFMGLRRNIHTSLRNMHTFYFPFTGTKRHLCFWHLFTRNYHAPFGC